MSFKELFIGNFTVDDHSCRLFEIAKQYHEKCDSFDSKICSGRSKFDSSPMPVGGYETAMINKHAHEVMRGIYSDNSDICPRKIRKAIAEYKNRR